MILICQEIKEVKLEGKKYFISRFILQENLSENSNYRAVLLEQATLTRPNLEPGNLYEISIEQITVPDEYSPVKKGE